MVKLMLGLVTTSRSFHYPLTFHEQAHEWSQVPQRFLSPESFHQESKGLHTRGTGQCRKPVNCNLEIWFCLDLLDCEQMAQPL